MRGGGGGVRGTTTRVTSNSNHRYPNNRTAFYTNELLMFMRFHVCVPARLTQRTRRSVLHR